jgi:hypothetical protein
MPRRRLRRRTKKRQRHASPASGADEVRVVVREATQVERLAYTRQQAAEALGISTSTFNRRVLPFIETLQMEWGTRLIPVDELERLVTRRRQKAQANPRPPARPGRKAALPPKVVARICDEHLKGRASARSRAAQCRRRANVAGRAPVVVLDGPGRSRTFKSTQIQRTWLEPAGLGRQ